MRCDKKWLIPEIKFRFPSENNSAQFWMMALFRVGDSALAM